MDSLTHIALGACIGQLCAGKTLGKKALLIGAAAQSLPDIDFVSSFWLSPANDLLAHRGFTHSILFALLVAYPLALILSRWHAVPSIRLRHLTLFIGFEILIHLFLDAFNAYGTGWFEPFSHYRVSFHTLFVADPFFSIGLLLVAAFLVYAHTSHTQRNRWAWIGIAASTLYLCYGLINKLVIRQPILNSLQSQHISYQRYFTTPTPGNTWLWYIVVESEDGFYIGYRSVFDSQLLIPFHFFSKNENLLNPLKNHEDVQHLIRFSQGYYVIAQYEDKLVFNDLRFGQMVGWDDPTGPFVFYYYLNAPDDNELLIQRGRFTKWNQKAFSSFITRIRGK